MHEPQGKRVHATQRTSNHCQNLNYLGDKALGTHSAALVSKAIDVQGVFRIQKTSVTGRRFSHQLSQVEEDRPSSSLCFVNVSMFHEHVG